MALPASYDSQDAAPEAIREHLVERDGKFYVEVDGMKSQVDFDKFSGALQKRLSDGIAELKSLQGKGMSRDEILEAIKEAGKGMGTGDPGGKGGDDNNPVVHELRRELAQLKDQVTQDSTARREAEARSAELTINSSIQSAATETKARAESVGTIGKILADQFEISSTGEPKSKEGCEFGANLSPSEVIAKVKGDPRYAPFWPGSKGGGAGSGDGTGDGGTGQVDKNPWTREHWNRTQQMQLVVKDKAQAEKLAKVAKSEIGATHPPAASA